MIDPFLLLSAFLLLTAQIFELTNFADRLLVFI